MSSTRALPLVVVLGVLLSACAPASAPPSSPATRAPEPTASPQPSVSAAASSPTPSATASLGAFPHVFVIVMENTSFARALADPYIAGLAKRYGLATNYHAVGSPSLPNYLALTSGSTWGISDDGYHVLPVGGIGAQLDEAGIPWRAYMDGLKSAGCAGSPYPYALKHNPFAYYGGRCPANVAPLPRDLSNEAANFVWITPDLCHDGHDCALATAAAWLAETVPQITASPAWKDRGTLFITWDEGDGSTDLVPLIVVSARVAGLSSSQRYDHYSLLATIEDALRLPRLGEAKAARPITDLVPPGP